MLVPLPAQKAVGLGRKGLNLWEHCGQGNEHLGVKSFLKVKGTM